MVIGPPHRYVSTVLHHFAVTRSISLKFSLQKDVDLRPRKNFVGWVRASIEMLLQGRKSRSFYFVNDRRIFSACHNALL